MRTVYPCPKCLKKAWLQIEGLNDVALRCPHCGLLKFIAQVTGNVVIIKVEKPTRSESFPKPGTKLNDCLMALERQDVRTTADLALELKQDPLETATQLTVLRMRGWVEPIRSNRGRKGGSIWMLTKMARDILR